MMVNDVISYSLYNDTGFTWERGLELTALLLMRRAPKKKRLSHFISLCAKFVLGNVAFYNRAMASNI